MSAFADFAARILDGTEGEEERALRLAAWCAEELRNEPASQPGTLAVLEERRGAVGARVRLYADLVKAAGGSARLFSTYTHGARHTTTHVMVGGREVFVDPVWGCVCRIDGDLVGFEEMHRRSEEAARSIEWLTLDKEKLADAADLAYLQRAQRIRRLYSAQQLAATRSFGFLNDDAPHPFHLSFDLSRLWRFPKSRSRDEKIQYIESARTFGIAIPNFFGFTDKRPEHHWEFENADPNDEYEIVYCIAGRKGSVTIEAASETADIVSPSSITIGDNDQPMEWRIRFRPHGERMMVRVGTRSGTGRQQAFIAEVRLERVEGPLLGREQPTYGIDDIILDADGRLPLNKERIIPPSDPERIKYYLARGKSLSTMIDKGAFHPWPQRPYNFTWIYDAMAAIFAHRATGDTDFLDWLVSTFDRILAFRDSETGMIDDFRGRAMNSWGSYVTLYMHGGRKGWVNEVCTAGCMVMPVLVFCHDILKNPAAAEKYKRAAHRYIPICQAVLEEFLTDVRYDEATESAYLVMPHDGEPEPTAHAAPYAASLAALHACTGESEPLELARKLANYFRASTSIDAQGVWSWPYRPMPGQMKGPGAYYFKARVSLIFPIIANSLGLIFSDDDMTKLAETFMSYVLTEDGTAYTTISGDQRMPLDDRQLLHFAERKMAMSLLQIVGYYPFTLFDPEVGKRIERFVSQNEVLFPEDFLSIPLGAESYAIRLDPRKTLRPLCISR